MTNLHPIRGRSTRSLSLALAAVTCLITTHAALASGGGCVCPGDIDGCGTVDVNDLINVFTAWGETGPDLPADVNDLRSGQPAGDYE